MGEVVPRGWRDRAFRSEEVRASENSDGELLAANDAETTNSHKAQNKTRKTCQPGALRPVRHITGQTPRPCAPDGGGRPFQGERNPRMRKGRATEPVENRSCRLVTSEASGRSTRCTSPRVPVGRAATSGDRGALGGDVPRPWGSGRHHATCTFLCHRAGAQVNQHQPFVHAISRFLKRITVRYQEERGAPFNADRDLRMDIVIDRGGLRDASASDVRH